MPKYKRFVYAQIITLAALAMLWFIFSTRASADFIRLRPPFSGTVRLTAFFDHQTPRCYWIGQPPCDGYVWIYTGERVLDYSPHPYDGHEGIDWALPDGTPVYAAASGVVAAFGSVGVGYGNRVVIDHQNGYFTLYAHLLGFNNLWVGKSVVAGDLIGSSDHDGCAPCGPHLHFGLYHHDWTAGHETDPFGWQGSVTDPLIDYNGETAICSWRSADEDPVSCADTIIEDAGRGSDIQGSGWLASSIGNGYHMYYHSNVNDYNVYASWWATSTIEGSYKVYVYIPSQNATITNADYLVWNGIDYYPDVYVNQQIYSDVWVLLGTYKLPANVAYVYLYSNSYSNTEGTKLVGADAVKFRSYLIYLPIALNNSP